LIPISTYQEIERKAYLILSLVVSLVHSSVMFL